MAAPVFGAGTAAPVAVKAGERVRTARFEFGTEDIPIAHRRSITGESLCAAVSPAVGGCSIPVGPLLLPAARRGSLPDPWGIGRGRERSENLYLPSPAPGSPPRRGPPGRPSRCIGLVVINLSPYVASVERTTASRGYMPGEAAPLPASRKGDPATGGGPSEEGATQSGACSFPDGLVRVTIL
ncbi:MAG: hypothetical protein NVS3B12_03200 [Acidimicrobiales bacterium]